MPKYRVGETVVIDMYGKKANYLAHYLYLKKLYSELIVGEIISVSTPMKKNERVYLYHVKCKNRYGHLSTIAVLEERILGKVDDVDILAKVI